MARGRKAVRDKNYEKALAAFSEATLANPSDSNALAERGFVKLLQNDTEGATNDLESAMMLASDPDLLSPIWFNLGLVREKTKDDEGARVAFANAHLLKPSAATRARTAGKSSCTVEVRKDHLTDLDGVSGWMGLHRAVGAPEELAAPAPKNDIEAQTQVCGENHFRQTPACSESSPFSLMRGYMLYMWGQIWVFPRGKEQFWVYTSNYRIGGWPARCSGTTSSTASTAGGLIRVQISNDGRDAAFDGEVNDEGRCKDAPGWTMEELFDEKTGKALASLHWMGSSNANVRVDGRAVVIEGAGCNERIALPQ